MHVRRGVVCLAILLGFPAFPATVPQDVPATDPGAALAAMERPRISGEIDVPEVLTVGQAEVRPAAGARVFLLAASGRTCGVLIDGSAAVTYRVRDRFSLPLARRNAGRASGITLRDALHRVRRLPRNSGPFGRAASLSS